MSILPALRGRFIAKLPNSDFLFVCLLAMLVIWGRWSITTSDIAKDWDEAQFIVSAWSASEDPVFFRVTDCGSSGPFNIWPLLWSYLVGTTPSQFTARLLASFFMAGISCLLFFAYRCLSGSKPLSRAAAVPIAAFFALNRTDAMGQYNSEIPSLFYMAVGIAAAAYILADCRQSSVWLIACIGGAFLSFCPLAKLQSAPMAVIIGIAILCATFYRMRGKNTLFLYLRIGLATAIAPLSFCALMIAGGEWEYFWQAYVLSAVNYRTLTVSGQGSMWVIFLRDALLASFVVTASVFSAVATGMAALKKNVLLLRWGPVFFAVVLCAAGIWTMTSPNKAYPHYLLYLLIPFATLAGASMSISPLSAIKTILLFYVVTGIPMLLCFRDVRWEKERPLGEGLSNLIAAIAGGAPELDDKISVWGYAPDVYFLAGRKSGTRIATTAFFFLNIPGSELYLDRYISDLKKNKPKLFVDVSPLQIKNREFPYLKPFTAIPVVAEFIKSNYKYAGTCAGAAFYSLNPQAPEAHETLLKK